MSEQTVKRTETLNTMSNSKFNLPGIYRGKIGNLIISSWKGRPYVKMKPERIKDARTPDQLMQRSKFALINHILSPLSPFLRLGFGAYTQQITAYNAAVSWNMKHSFDVTGGQTVIDYSRLQFSRGAYSTVENAGCRPAGGLNLELSWNPGHKPGRGRDDDRIFAVVVNETLDESNYYAEIAGRSSGYATIHLATARPGDIIHCYLTVLNPARMPAGKNRQYIADSIYMGRVVLG